MKKWLETAKTICYLLKSDDFDGQKVVLAGIFGLNLFLHNKKPSPKLLQVQAQKPLSERERKVVFTCRKN